MLSMSRRQCAFVVILVLLAVAPTLASAAGLVPIVPQNSSCNGSGGCQSICDIATLAQNILNDAIFFAVFLSAGLFAYAGFKMLVSPASSAQLGKSKTLFYNVLIGFIVILAAWLVVNTLMGIMVNGQGGLPWNKICD